MKFEKGINIASQLARLQKSSTHQRQTDTSRHQKGPDDGNVSPHSSQFEGLKLFYRTALSDADPNGPVPGLGSSFGLESPSHLSRLLSQYGIGGLKKQKQKPKPMLESASVLEGLQADALDTGESTVERIRSLGWSGTVTVEQKHRQTMSPGSHVTQESLNFTGGRQPVPVKLRSRRAKRCQICRYHILRPDDKRHSTRYKVRLLALTYVPRITAAPLKPLTAKLEALQPGTPQQFVLTCRNPLYDPVKVKLGTPNVVPGESGSRVTLLCPEFDIGASADVWDEALSSSKAADAEGTASKGTAEAGKIWKRGRNWTSIVLEVIPSVAKERSERDTQPLEVPIFVRVEYSVDAASTAPPEIISPDTSPGWKSAKEEKLPRELEFWIVLGLGKVAIKEQS
ncbi:MAG: hypothetical protein Q9162_002700 [Coniocarpon cinnabarinum]